VAAGIEEISVKWSVVMMVWAIAARAQAQGAPEDPPSPPAPSPPEAAPQASPAAPADPSLSPPGAEEEPPSRAPRAPAPLPRPDAPASRHGVTVEANLGLAYMWASAGTLTSNAATALGGLDLGIGGWIGDDAALTLRAAGATHSETGGRATGAFFGPSLQYWITPNAWFGVGGGLGVLSVSLDGFPALDPVTGVGLDLRAGYTFATASAESFNLSVEVTPLWLSARMPGGNDLTLTALCLLFGYQHL
jgi:hypothetical protein